MEAEKKAAEEAEKKNKQKSMLGFLQNWDPNADNEEGSFELSFAGLFKCMFCTYQKPVNEGQQLVRIADSLETLGKRIDGIEKWVFAEIQQHDHMDVYFIYNYFPIGRW